MVALVAEVDPTDLNSCIVSFFVLRRCLLLVLPPAAALVEFAAEAVDVCSPIAEVLEVLADELVDQAGVWAVIVDEGGEDIAVFEVVWVGCDYFCGREFCWEVVEAAWEGIGLVTSVLLW